MKYKIWDREETLVTPIGEVLTKEQYEEIVGEVYS
jgi:hypothetical protein